MIKETESCPCGSPSPYAACCGVYIAGQAEVDTAEHLMRSRYSAYVMGCEAYLLRTWHASTRPPALRLDKTTPTRWLGLKIQRTAAGGVDDVRGVVEFVARYKIGGKAKRLHEVSHFVKEHGLWFYVSGDTPPARQRS